MVYEYEIRSIVNSNIIRKKIDDRDYRVIKYQGTRYYSEMVELNELIRKIKMNWPNDEVFFYDKDLRPFEERMIKLFEVFVIPDKIEEFKKITYNF